MTISSAQSVVTNPVTTHSEFASTGFPTVSLGSGATSGNLITGYIYDTAVSATFTPPSGWSTAIQFNGSHSIGGVAIEYKVSTGGETAFSPTQTTGTGAMVVAEWAGCATSSPVDQTGSAERSANGTSLAVSTSGSVAQSNELMIAAFGNGNSIGGWTMTGWTRDYDALEGSLGSLISTTASGTQTVTFSWTNTGLCSGIIATFLPLVTDADPTLVRAIQQLNVYRMHHREFDRELRRCRHRFVADPQGPWMVQRAVRTPDGRVVREVSDRERLRRMGLSYGVMR